MNLAHPCCLSLDSDPSRLLRFSGRIKHVVVVVGYPMASYESHALFFSMVVHVLHGTVYTLAPDKPRATAHIESMVHFLCCTSKSPPLLSTEHRF